jgi:para-nitrobenzyl esterase
MRRLRAHVHFGSLLALAGLLLMPTFGAAYQAATPVATPSGIPPAPPVIVDTPDGSLRGLDFGTYVLFRGIPYAAPPVGDLRWQPPQPAAIWSGVRDATQSGSPCPQAPDPLYGGDAGAEDCLFLEVTAPREAGRQQPKPVLVWVHGGGFIGAAGSFFDAHRLAADGDLVVVSINYRLGILGYFGYPGLDGSGAFGLQDQRAALEWVQRNIAAFGGDPGNVTLMGESAGAMSICAHLTAPGGEELFHRAIIQSGPCTMSWPANVLFPGVPGGSLWRSPDEVEGLGQAVAESAGCADPESALDCLRELAPADLLALPLAGAYGSPAWGSDFLPANPAEQLRAGEFQRMPIISGVTRDESTLFVAAFFAAEPITAEAYRQLLAEAFGNAAAKVAARYEAIAAESPAQAWARISTDRVWACPTQQSNRLFADRTTVHAYEFADPAPPPILPDAGFPLGAYHSSEIPYLFDYVGTGAAEVLSPEQLALARTMVAYWANFAHTGDPNSPGLPAWAAFEADAAVPAVLALVPDPNGIAPIDFDAEHQCAFWAEHGLE